MDDRCYYNLEKIQTEFIKYAPAYAQEEAKEAIAKVMDLQKQGVIRDGLYYIVLVDLVGSTEYGTRHAGVPGTQYLIRKATQRNRACGHRTRRKSFRSSSLTWCGSGGSVAVSSEAALAGFLRDRARLLRGGRSKHHPMLRNFRRGRPFRTGDLPWRKGRPAK